MAEITTPIRTFSIGFTKKSAEEFFTMLENAGVKRVLDVRLNNRSQLAGFSKSEDLRYFLKAIGGIEYEHVPELAPTKEILDAYKKHGGDWAVYALEFLELIARRGIEKQLTPEFLDGSCLLCSEPTAEYCHRLLVLDYLNKHWGGVSISHLT